MEKPNITQEQLDRIKPILEKALSKMYKQDIEILNYNIKEDGVK